MGELEQKIMGILMDQNIPHEVVEHEPVYTNPEMAERLGVKVGETVKNLMLSTADGRIIQVVLPGPVEQFLTGVDAHRAAVHHGHGPPGGIGQTLGLAT